MIEFNNTFCPYCCNIFRSFVYVTDESEYLIIKKNRVGQYAIHNFANCKHIETIKIKNMDTLNGLPYRTIIEIKYSNEKQERQEVLTSSKRVCPHCLKSGQKKKSTDLCLLRTNFYCNKHWASIGRKDSTNTEYNICRKL